MPSAKGLLTKLGFSPLEEAIYLKLISRGPLSISSLAQVVGKHRPVVYRALPRLLAVNLIAPVSKGGRLTYRAESPAMLLALAKNRLERIQEVLPRLLNIFQNKDQKPKISFFEGREGIATVYEQLITQTQKDQAIYRYESPREYDRNKRYYPALYWKRAGATGDIDKFVITNKKTQAQRRANLNRFSKAVEDPFDQNISQIIGEEAVIFIDYDTETAVLIESSRFAKFQKTIFKLLFDRI